MKKIGITDRENLCLDRQDFRPAVSAERKLGQKVSFGQSIESLARANDLAMANKRGREFNRRAVDVRRRRNETGGVSRWKKGA